MAYQIGPILGRKIIDMIFEENREQAKRVNRREEGRRKGKDEVERVGI